MDGRAAVAQCGPDLAGCTDLRGALPWGSEAWPRPGLQEEPRALRPWRFRLGWEGPVPLEALRELSSLTPPPLSPARSGQRYLGRREKRKVVLKEMCSKRATVLSSQRNQMLYTLNKFCEFLFTVLFK